MGTIPRSTTHEYMEQVTEIVRGKVYSEIQSKITKPHPSSELVRHNGRQCRPATRATAIGRDEGHSAAVIFFAFGMTNDCLAFILVSFVAAFASDWLAWYFVYRNPGFQRMYHAFESLDKLIKNKTITGARRSDAIASFKTTTGNLALSSLKAQLYGSGLMILLVPLVVRCYADRAVATLPFEPMWYFKSMAQQGLTNPRSTDCSAVFLFLLSLSVMRNLTRKLLPAPEIPSIWTLKDLK